MGGIGCGWFEARQDGTFQNWNIFNNRPLGRGNHFSLHPHTVLFFVVRFQVEGEDPALRLLQIEESHDSAAFSGHEHQYIFPWLTGVDRIEYSASFPFVRMNFAEASMPLEIELEAWSPFIPHDVKNSSLPMAGFNFRVRSTCAKPVDVSLMACMRNTVGYDLKYKSYQNRPVKGAGYSGFELGGADMDATHASFGTMGIVALSEDATSYIGWEHPHPYYERVLRETRLPDLDDTAGRNYLDKETGRTVAGTRCFATVAQFARLQKEGDRLDQEFLATWHFPNNHARLPGDEDGGPAGYLEDVDFPGNEALKDESSTATSEPRIEGHFYSKFFQNATEVAEYAAANRASLYGRTREFHDAFFDSTVEPYILDQVNSHLNTFRTSSWLTREGNFGILEGLSPTKSFAGLGTTDVAMYGHVAAAALFPELDRTLMRAHKYFQNENGSVIHSIDQNFDWKNPREASATRLDMPAQYSYMVLRGFFWSGDRAYLEEMWPSVKRALEYVLRERDYNGDCLPDMEGVMCSYDNFPMYGVAPYVATQWLVAVASAIKAAEILGDGEARERYQKVLTAGTSVLEQKTWNGTYYRLYSDEGGVRGDVDEGCMTDQVIGEWAANLVGLPPLLDSERVRSALQSVMRMNYKASQGLRNCQWPGDAFLHDVAEDCWVDQANTCWTGVELAFASLLIYKGLYEEGAKVIKNVDDRYRRWGLYWDHQEFGGHYFRPMSAWSIMHALLGLEIQDGHYTFAPKIGPDGCKILFMTADGYAHYSESPGAVEFRVICGQWQFRSVKIQPALGLASNFQLKVEAISGLNLVTGDQFVELSGDGLMTVAPGQVITISRL